MELERMVTELAAAIQRELNGVKFAPGKVSLWLKFIRYGTLDGSAVEETVGPVQKMVHTVSALAGLVETIAEHAVLTVYGAEAPIVPTMPNLIVKLPDRKVKVAVAGAPPLAQPGQIFLKVTVYRFEPSLWEQLFGRKPAEEAN